MFNMPSLLRSRAAVAAAALMTAFPAFAAEGALPEGWNTYANARFGYQICYPAALLTPEPEADNGDGRVFTSPSGVTLRVWGSFNAAEKTLHDIAEDLGESQTENGGEVTDHVMEDDWAMISGTSDKDGDTLFHAKIFFNDDVENVFLLTYPESEAHTFDDVAVTMNSCFRPAR